MRAPGMPWAGEPRRRGRAYLEYTRWGDKSGRGSKTPRPAKWGDRGGLRIRTRHYGGKSVARSRAGVPAEAEPDAGIGLGMGCPSTMVRVSRDAQEHCSKGRAR